jgi:predicted membrane-bound spermidine synthase
MNFNPRRASLHVGVFLIALSGLMFEIGLTRIFSATIWYHFAFVAVSVALLGWGLGGLAVHILKSRLPMSLDLAGLCVLLYAVAIPAGLFFIVRLPFRPERLAAYFVAALVPFLLAGMALSIVFDLRRESTGGLYFADLLGASLGALAVTVLLSWLGGEAAVLAVAIAPALAASLFSRRLVFASACLTLAILVGLALNGTIGLFKIKSAPSKGMYQHLLKNPGSEVVLTGWNSYSRIDAVTGVSSPFLARLYIDSDAWTNIIGWDGRAESVQHMRQWYRALPFKLVPHSRTLVIGPGGGSDVLVAIASGAQSVTAVEMNPLMLSFVRHFGSRAGDLYDHPLVDTQLSEGRNFISRTKEKYDVILLGFVDSWASVASGGLSLSENYLYTTEALRAYYDHLTEDGILVIIRWDVDIPRLVSNSVALLGAEAARERVVVLLEKRRSLEEPPQMIFMLRRRPFTEVETAQIMGEWTLARPVIVPGRFAEAPFGDLLEGRKTLEQYVAEATVRVDPVFDDRPFYFARRKPWGLPQSMTRPLLEILAPVALLLVLIVVLGRPAPGSSKAYAGSIVYFAALGLGFIAVELALLQDLTLFLGHPIFTLSVLLFTLLASSGLGSWASGAFSVRAVCVAIFGLAATYAFLLPALVRALLFLSLPLRIGVAVAIIAPLGFAMGMPFPRGLLRVGREGLPPPPFYWGLNGILSVIGSVGTMVVAITLGFRAALLAGSVCYLVAAFAASSLGDLRAET